MAVDHEYAGLVDRLLDYPNISPLIGMAISSDPALLGPLSSTLGLEDLHDIVEVMRVDAHNRRIIQKARET